MSKGITENEKKLARMIKQRGCTDHDDYIYFMLMCRQEEWTDDAIEFLEENPDATFDDVFDYLEGENPEPLEIINDDSISGRKSLIGAVVGDVVGSVYEFSNIRTKDFPLFKEGCFATDDSIMTLAVAKAIMESSDDRSDLGANAVKYMQEVGRPYPGCGYGGSFYNWIYSSDPQPYNSFGNGAAMRPGARAASVTPTVRCYKS